MASHDEQDIFAVAAFSEVETSVTLSMRCGLARLGGNGEPEHRSKRTTNVDG